MQASFFSYPVVIAEMQSRFHGWLCIFPQMKLTYKEPAASQAAVVLTQADRRVSRRL
jgi:hypothetical protein